MDVKYIIIIYVTLPKKMACALPPGLSHCLNSGRAQGPGDRQLLQGSHAPGTATPLSWPREPLQSDLPGPGFSRERAGVCAAGRAPRPCSQRVFSAAD